MSKGLALTHTSRTTHHVTLLSPELYSYHSPCAQLMRAYQCMAVGTGFAEGFEVRLDAGGGKGKGLFAERQLAKGDELLREAHLVGVQTHDNSAEVLVCSHCFRFLGAQPTCHHN